jgi:chromosome segregation protein
VRVAREGAEHSERLARSMRDQLRNLEADRERALRELAELQARTRHLDAERGELADAAEVLGREIQAASDRSSAAHEDVDGAQDALNAARLAALAAREQDASARGELGRAEDLLTALEGRMHGLEGLERERVGLAPAAARLLEDRDRFGDGAILGPLSDFVSADANSAAAVERFLGMTVHAVLVRDQAAADAIREWHADVSPGPLLLLPADATMPDESAGAGTNGDLLSALEVSPAAARWVRVLLERVRALDDGAFVDPRGAIWLPGAAAGPGPLRRRAELQNLREEVATAARTRDSAAAATEASRAALLEAEAAVNTAVDALHAAQNVERQAREALAELERRQARYNRELEESRSLSGQLSQRVEAITAQVRDNDGRQEEAREQATRNDATAVEQREALVAAESGMDTVRDARSEGQVILAQAQARLQVTQDRERRVVEARDSAAHRLASLSDELGQLDESDRALMTRMAGWQADLDAGMATLIVAEAELDAAERDVVAANERVAGAEHALDATRSEAQRRGETLHHAELRFTELSGRRAAIRERLEAEWKRPLDDLLRTLQPLDLDDDSLRTEAAALQQQLDALGPVNPLAIEEHEDEVKRLDFLTTQRADLTEGRNSLLAAIREIDATARELFLTTFTQVRENFRRIFMTLFGGGECDLRLENHEAPLDCDIEVHASPRGKRTQRIHLLSSGERALVALSLLFGIFLTKPSPFCLLDEVDAPLDDANIGRFVRMLNEFKLKTQFIVITHNPRTTTEAADAVYGITMQEPGVSSVVSVRMRGPQVDDTATEHDTPVERSMPVEPVSEAVTTSL